MAPARYGLGHALLRLLTVVTALGFFAHIWFIFVRTPEAQAAAGGLAQKVFYFHVPAAYAMYLAGGVCFLGSAASPASHLGSRRVGHGRAQKSPSPFGFLVLTSGPLWAKKAWASTGRGSSDQPASDRPHLRGASRCCGDFRAPARRRRSLPPPSAFWAPPSCPSCITR